MKMIVYTKTGCPWCNDALDYLKKNKILFEERNVTANPEFMDEMVNKSGQTKAPTLDIGGEILADTSAEEIAAYLAKKGIKFGQSTGGKDNICPIE